MLPAWSSKLLPDGQSTNSVNSYLFSGELEGWRLPKLLYTLQNPNTAFAYRIPTTTVSGAGVDTFNSSITGPSKWIEFLDPDTNVVRSQIVADQFQRYYAASPSQGAPTYNTLARIQAGSPFFQLGIPAPATAPIVGVSGGGSSATLGPTTANGAVVNVNGNTVYLFPIVPSGALLLNSIQFLPNNTNGLVQFAGVIYADAATGGNVATTPGALLGVGTVIAGVTSSQLATTTFTNPIALASNTPYWIGITVSQTIQVQEADTFNASVQFNNTFSNGPPGFAPAVTPGQPDLVIFANLSISVAIVEARTYVYTYVSAYGEEGPPSPPTLLNGWSNGTWTVTPTLPPATYFGGNGLGNIAFLRIYRTVVSAAGAATYFFVADISIGSTDPDAIAAVANDPLVNGVGCLSPRATYTDNQLDSTVALNLQMPSTNYFAPPTNMQGITVMPNGMYVGFINNQIWFSVPYLPHAWPPGFVYTVDFPVIGLGVTSGALVAVTGSTAWIFNGTSPASLSQVKCMLPAPCTSRGSILSTDIGVYYHSIEGLIQIQNAPPAANATLLWITREKWDALTPQLYTRAMALVGTYFCFGTVSPPSVSPQDTSQAQSGFNVELNTDNTSFTIWPQPGGHKIGFNLMNAPFGNNVVNVMNDSWTGVGLMIQGGGVYYYDFTDLNYVMQPYDFTTKVYQQTTKKSFEAMRVFFNTIPSSPVNTTVARNQSALTDPSWSALSSTQWGIILVYADVDDGDGDGSMQLVTAREIRRSGELLRIESGFKAENWQYRILGRVIISNIQVATSAKELANV